MIAGYVSELVHLTRFTLTIMPNQRLLKASATAVGNAKRPVIMDIFLWWQEVQN